jgi:hypothetical protein
MKSVVNSVYDSLPELKTGPEKVKAAEQEELK